MVIDFAECVLVSTLSYGYWQCDLCQHVEPKIVAYFKGRCSLRNELANLRFPSE